MNSSYGMNHMFTKTSQFMSSLDLFSDLTRKIHVQWKKYIFLFLRNIMKPSNYDKFSK